MDGDYILFIVYIYIYVTSSINHDQNLSNHSVRLL